MSIVIIATSLLFGCEEQDAKLLTAREEVVFWHFWGGRDRPIVESIVQQFNDSQDRYRVHAIAMPGANLDLKFFLSVAGGDPPDLMNHDDPVLADWAYRGVVTPLDELASDEELSQLKEWLFPAALKMSTYQDRFFALCNGLDIRAFYCNKTLLDEHGLPLPETIEDLDRIAETIAPAADASDRKRMGYLPDPRRLWAWGIVFGGELADVTADEVADQITADSPEILAALKWMAGYSERYGPSNVAAFRSGEQALTGASFPLLADRRYAVMMDGQWRVRDLAEATEVAAKSNKPMDEFTVAPLPSPPEGRRDAGWVNGNFFIVPQQARCKAGAWEFMKFWTGFVGSEAIAAEACAAGGWIPVSQEIVDQDAYQQALADYPLLSEFVRLAASPNQAPVPGLPIASVYYQNVIRAAQEVMYRGADPEAELKNAAEQNSYPPKRGAEMSSQKAPTICLPLVGSGFQHSCACHWCGLLLTSVKSPEQNHCRNPTLGGQAHFRLENFEEAVSVIPFFKYLFNSVLLCLGSVLGTLVSCTSGKPMDFSRLRWPGRDLIFGLLIATMLLPWQVTMVPRFLVIRELGALRFSMGVDSSPSSLARHSTYFS